MRAKIRLDTMRDIQGFVNAVSTIPESVILEDNDGNRVSAKSLIGAIYTMEWACVYCYCNKDIYHIISPWII